jgi:multiple sugar transport system substrate-binding protein
MKLRTLAGALIGTALVAAQAGVALADEIRVWHHGGRGDGERELIAQYIDEWNKANPDHPAKLEILPEGAYNEQVQAAALAGNLPDLLDFDGPNYANYVWSGYLIPLNGVVDQAVIDNAIPSIIAQGTYPPDGKLYSLGQHDSGLALWGNRVYLEKAGVRIPTSVEEAWTLAEFEDALAKLQALDEVEYALDLKLNYGKGEWFTYGFSPIIQSMGGDLIDRTTWRAEGTLNSDASVEAMTHFQDWVRKGYVVPASAGDDAFYGKKSVGLSLVGHWMWPAHSKALGDDLVLLPMPKWGDTHVTGMGSWCWGITKNAENPEVVGRLLAFLLEDERLLGWSNRGGHPPATKTVTAKSELFGQGGPLSLYADQLAKGVGLPRPVHPAYPVITASFAQAVADIVDGGDVREALTRAAEDIDQNIEDNDGYPPFGQ